MSEKENPIPAESDPLNFNISTSFLRNYRPSENNPNIGSKITRVFRVPLASGQTIRHYCIQKELGHGGMGEVYQAMDTSKNMAVAIKRLTVDNESVRKRFEREHLFLSNITHPNLIKAYDYFEQDGDLFIVLELVIGSSLQNLIREKNRSLSLVKKLAIAAKVARGVEVINAAGIIHRDIKPANIMVNIELGQVKILDFGLGKDILIPDTLTQTGAILGTLAYLSPEQTHGNVSERSDIFSLGVTLYQLFSGIENSPFQGDSQLNTFYQIGSHHPPPLDKLIKANSSQEQKTYLTTSKILAKAMKKKPQNRWASAGEMANQLEVVQQELLQMVNEKTEDTTLLILSTQIDEKLKISLDNIRTKHKQKENVPPRNLAKIRKRWQDIRDIYNRVKENRLSHAFLRNLLTIAVLFLVICGIIIFPFGRVNNNNDNEKIPEESNSKTKEEEPDSRLIKEMQQQYKELKQLEGRDIDMDINAWNDFLDVYSKDIASSSEDEKIRSHARTRIDQLNEEKKKLKEKTQKNIPEGFIDLGTKTYSCGDQTNTMREYLHKATGMEFVLVPGGSFQMGSNDYDGEKPIHNVTLKSFLMSKHEVTQGVWRQIMRTTPWKGKNYVKEGDNYPAVFVSWDDAKKFCSQTGLSLPSEAQWEYACRSGTKTKYYWGNNIDGGYLWYNKNAWDIGEKYAHKVGQKQPNAFGLYDMSGNVWEWCEDKWHNNYQGAPRDGSAWTIASSSFRLFRGGGLRFGAETCRSARRAWFSPGYRGLALGFRLLRPAP